MASEGELRIVSADRFDDSIIIGFSDGRGGRYPITLLYGMLSQTEELFEPGPLGDFDEPNGRATPSTPDDVK